MNERHLPPPLFSSKQACSEWRKVHIAPGEMVPGGHEIEFVAKVAVAAVRKHLQQDRSRGKQPCNSHPAGKQRAFLRNNLGYGGRTLLRRFRFGRRKAHFHGVESYRESRRAARRAARWGRARMTTFSCRLCAPSPTPPRPSSVGTPKAAVKLPSEPPPVKDSSSFSPIVIARACARRKRATLPPCSTVCRSRTLMAWSLVRSRGGRRGGRRAAAARVPQLPRARMTRPRRVPRCRRAQALAI